MPWCPVITWPRLIGAEWPSGVARDLSSRRGSVIRALTQRSAPGWCPPGLGRSRRAARSPSRACVPGRRELRISLSSRQSSFRLDAWTRHLEVAWATSQAVAGSSPSYSRATGPRSAASGTVSARGGRDPGRWGRPGRAGAAATS